MIKRTKAEKEFLKSIPTKPTPFKDDDGRTLTYGFLLKKPIKRKIGNIRYLQRFKEFNTLKEARAWEKKNRTKVLGK